MAKKTTPPETMSDPVLEEIEENLMGYSYNMKSPATDADGNVWKKVCFAGPNKVFKKLVQHPIAQRLETLTIGDLDESGSFKGAIKLLAAGPPFAALRELRLGLLPEGQDDSVDFAARTAGDLSALATACPNLETLRLLCPVFIAGAHPTLRVLDARVGAKSSSVASLARAALPKLEELHLGFEVDREDGLYPSLFWTAKTLAPLLAGDVLPSLKRLYLWPTQDDDALLTKAKASPLGKRVSISLRSLDDIEEDTDAYTL